MDHYDDIYRIDAFDEWVNGAYDENGDTSVCDMCGGDMRWNPVMQNWYCRECEQIMDRPTYFNHIGANPPGPECITNCQENYPFCKKHCDHYKIDPNDPMLD